MLGLLLNSQICVTPHCLTKVIKYEQVSSERRCHSSVSWLVLFASVIISSLLRASFDGSTANRKVGPDPYLV